MNQILCLRQSCYQGISLRGQGQGQERTWTFFQGQGQGQDFFLKAKAKDIKIFRGQLKQLLLRAKICIAVTETEHAYSIKHNAKETICDGFDV